MSDPDRDSRQEVVEGLAENLSSETSMDIGPEDIVIKNNQATLSEEARRRAVLEQLTEESGESVDEQPKSTGGG